jgi:hypothetical protein
MYPLAFSFYKVKWELHRTSTTTSHLQNNSCSIACAIVKMLFAKGYLDGSFAALHALSLLRQCES